MQLLSLCKREELGAGHEIAFNEKESALTDMTCMRTMSSTEKFGNE